MRPEVAVLDTARLPLRERADAVHAAYRGQPPQRAVVVDQHPVRFRSVRLDLGAEMHMIRASGTAMQIQRTARLVRLDAPEYVALGLHRRGRSLVSAGGTETELRDGHLNCVDVTSPYELSHRGFHVHEVLIVSNRQAGVSVDTVRAAAPVLARSPLYDLVRAHVANLFGAARDLPAGPRLLAGTATIALVRALLSTAADAADRRDALDDALDARVTLFIDGHLGDPGLDAARIAAAHNVSVRHLYQVWRRAGHERSLAQWIIDRRLDRAREQLTTSDPRRHTIASVARANGFTGVSHFSRRFRAAFGVTPGEWRAAFGVTPR